MFAPTVAIWVNVIPRSLVGVGVSGGVAVTVLVLALVDRDNNIISCGKLTIISCQLQCISAGFGKLCGSHCLGGVAKGYLSRTGRLFPTVSYRSVGLAIIGGRSIQGHSISGKGD